ncbi:MAG: lysophospholipid acyltransferase family protein [Gemmataceae bacterium]
MWILALMLVLLSVLYWRWRRSGLILIEFVCLGILHAYARWWYRCSHHYLAPLPRKGAVVLASNHTCSTDPLFLTVSCPRLICFLFAQEYYRVPLVWWLFDYLQCVPVLRNGRDVTAVRQALKRLADGLLVCVFPEGGLRNAGRAVVRNGKAGATLLALRSGAPLVPVSIRGGPQTSHVARSWLMPTGRCTHVLFGPVVDLSAYRGQPITRPLLEQANRLVMAALAELEKRDCHRQEVLQLSDYRT